MKGSATNIQIFNWGCDFDKTLRYEVKPNTAAYSCTLSKLISTWNRNSATLKTLLPSFLFAQCLCYLFCQLLDGVIHFLQCPFSMSNGSYLLRDTPLYRFCSFFKHFSKRLCTFSLFVSILSKFYANIVSISCHSAIRKSVLV